MMTTMPLVSLSVDPRLLTYLHMRVTGGTNVLRCAHKCAPPLLEDDPHRVWVAFEDFTGVVLGGALLSRFTDVWTAYTIAASQEWVHALFFYQGKSVPRRARVHKLAAADATFQVLAHRHHLRMNLRQQDAVWHELFLYPGL
jgi:hypothetical protein